MKLYILLACMMPMTALAQTGYEQPQQAQWHYRDPVVPIIPALPPQGFAVYERERPLPPQWGVDSYKSYKVIPLDRYGQPTQPLVTFDEVLTDMVWGSLHEKENK
jgi:hypothetical protein